MVSNTYYNSVQTHIFAKATSAPYNHDEILVGDVEWDIREQVIQHKNPQLTEEEKEWLIELLVWKKLFPGEEPGFPGKRPHNSDHPHLHISHGYMPTCRTCVDKGLKAEDCPYVRHVACNKKEEHPIYLVRLGYEDFLGPDCPACYSEELDGRGKKKTVDEK